MSEAAADGSPRAFIWRDGELLPPEWAVVPVWDHGFLYGDGVFEGIHLRAGRLFRLEAHLRRLRRSARILAIEPLHDDAAIHGAVAACCRANRLTEAHVRVILTRGSGQPGLDPDRCPRSSLYVLAYRLAPPLGTEPVALITSSVVRKAPRSLDAAAKSLNYVDSVMAKLQARAAGAADALLLDGEGYVAEATAANVFGVRDGQVFTPAPTAALAGITRDTVIRLAREAGEEVRERRVTVGDLMTADEVFLTGTAVGVVPVGSLDGRPLPRAPGPWTSRLAAGYVEVCTSERWSVEL